MPILNDILDHQVIGPAIREGLQQGLKQGLKQGLEQGLEQGMQKGRKEILRRQLEKRFGPLPSAIETQLSILSEAQLDDLALRLLDAGTLDELFPR